jgi:hypothetical protein
MIIILTGCKSRIYCIVYKIHQKITIFTRFCILPQRST